MQAFREAADGIRTHDLLHGKQTVVEGMTYNVPANMRFPRVCAQPGCLGFHADSRQFED
jgi:hypothetical protein